MQLPNEIVVTNILSCLPVQDILSCSEVSHDFHNLCQDQYLWKQLYQRDYGIVTESGLRKLQEVGHQELYKYYRNLTVQMYIILGIRTKWTPVKVISDPTSVAYCIMHTDASVTFIKVTCPVVLKLDFHMENGVGGHFTLRASVDTYYAETLHHLFVDREVSQQGVQEVVENLVTNGHYRTVNSSFNSNLEPMDNLVRDLLDFGLMKIPGLEKLPSKKMRN